MMLMFSNYVANDAVDDDDFADGDNNNIVVMVMIMVVGVKMVSMVVALVPKLLLTSTGLSRARSACLRLNFILCFV